MKKLVLLGGGHSQIEVLRQIGMRPIEGVAVTVISRELMAPYSGMLPGFIAGDYSHREAHIDLRNLADAAGARLVYAEATGLDPAGKRVLFEDRPAVSYDLLSINIGSRPVVSDVVGVDEFALPAKPVDVFIQGWERVLDRAIGAKESYTITIVGAGAGGVELALMIRHRVLGLCKEIGKDPGLVKINVVTDEDVIVPSHNGNVRKRLMRSLYRSDVRVHVGQRVVTVEKGSIRTDSGQVIAGDSVVWVTNAGTPKWLGDCGLYVNDDGFVLIDQTLRTMSHENIFATGDVATLEKFTRPKSGVFAVRQGPFLAANIRHHFAGENLELYVPQEQFLSLIGVGNKRAIASKGGFSAEGRLMWRWKDRIDRKFMDKYSVDPMMGGMDSADDGGMARMHCAGCGSKVGHTILGDALERLKAAYPDAGEGISYGDDAALVSFPEDSKVVISVDHFRSFLDDPFLFGAVTAVHCVSDVYAMGGSVHSALASVTLPYSLEAHQGDVLFELLAGAYSVLGEDGASLVGGHTAEGEDFFFGLTVNGIVSGDVIPKRGAQDGDALILTKGIGTGVLLVGDQQRMTRGPWLNAVLDSMLESNRGAAGILRDHATTSMTDVTGFGLAGHLLEMLQDSNLEGRVLLEDVPLHAGALELSEAGLRSTLYPENIRNEHLISNAGDFQMDARYPLLFDPQSSGGLLATVPAERVEDCLAAFAEAGNSVACVIGSVVADGGASGRLLLS